ncbi:MAG: ATP-grasp domain-containing protein [Lentisphaeria bacterium]|nr:ATP-grasp domain-containing protein [Lentisphaeria bacterium]
MKKKLLILGAMEMHVPLILRAKKLGLHTITCDYLPDNPGHKIADEAFFDSTTDLEAVTELATRLKVDGVMTYNSDPAAPTAAYVAEKLKLPGNPYHAVKIMSEKDLFRQFLREHDLNVPRYKNFKAGDDIKGLEEFRFPVIVKPVDSSGSKGCTVVDTPHNVFAASLQALTFSRCNRFIVEEYIVPRGAQLHGDGFVKDGKIVFLYLGDHHFDANVNNLVPYSTTYPTTHPQDEFEQCIAQLQKFMSLVGFKNGGFNVELRISNANGKAYIIDIGARNGGNFTPKIIEYATGFNFMDKAIALAMGWPVTDFKFEQKGFFSHLILHSRIDGIIDKIEISEEIQKRTLESHIYLHKGDHISAFLGASSAAGVLLMRYESKEIMDHVVDNFNDLYSIKLIDQ